VAGRSMTPVEGGWAFWGVTSSWVWLSLVWPLGSGRAAQCQVRSGRGRGQVKQGGQKQAGRGKTTPVRDEGSWRQVQFSSDAESR
jgi:hypothetical protein